MTWLADPIAWWRRRRETRLPPPPPRPVAIAATLRCHDCGRDFTPPSPHHSSTCWWCASYADEPDPYLDLGGGD